MKLKGLLNKLKDKWARCGYTCDFCGKDVFHYPASRLCERCENAFIKNDKFTCVKCGRATVTEGACLLCKTTFPLFDRAFSPYVYYGDVAVAINRFKQGSPHLAYLFAEKMVEYIQTQAIDLTDAVVTYVPLDVDKKRERGYDQAEELARIFSSLLGVPMVRALYSRVKEQQQKELTVQQRLKNAEKLYRLTDKKRIAGKTVLLVDDIMTTGATGSECAYKMIKGGAKQVYFVTASALPERK